MTKLIISTLAAAIALSSVSSTFAAPKQGQGQKVQEPTYCTLATGENSSHRKTINRTPDSQNHSRRTTMTKLIISTLAAAIALSSVSTTFAAPKQGQSFQ